MDKGHLMQLAALVEAYAVCLPEEADADDKDLRVNLGSTTLWCVADRPHALAMAEKLRNTKTYKTRVPKEKAPKPYLCSGGPFAGQQLWLTGARKGTFAFRVGEQRGRYVCSGDLLRWEGAV